MPSGFIPVERPAGAVDIEDVARAHYALEEAHGGNLTPLLERLRSECWLSQEERALAADLIKTHWKRGQAGRPSDGKSKGKALWLALNVSLLMAGGAARKAAVADVMNREKVSRSTVYDAIRDHPQFFPSS